MATVVALLASLVLGLVAGPAVAGTADADDATDGASDGATGGPTDDTTDDAVDPDAAHLVVPPAFVQELARDNSSAHNAFVQCFATGVLEAESRT